MAGPTQGGAVPQLTFRAVLLAIVLAVILAAANAYLGLFAGLTIATAIPAAVVSMGVLRLLGGGTILENNIVQTGASAGSSIAAGVIFTIPALVILGYWDDFRYWWVLAIAGLGGLLGVLFSVPLRRTMIVEDPLPFPEGKAAAEVLKAGENPGPGLKVLGLAAAVGAVVKLAAESGLRMIPDNAVVSALESVISYGESQKIPVIAAEGDSVARGAVATFGIDYTAHGKQAGEMAVKILTEGADPASLPAERAPEDSLKLYVNEEAAEKMGVTIPEDMLAEAEKLTAADAEESEG